VLLGFLLDIANFLGDLLQCVFVRAVLYLEVCKIVRAWPQNEPGISDLVASSLVLLEMPWLPCRIRRGELSSGELTSW
jgi:hypothetical protein